MIDCVEILTLTLSCAKTLTKQAATRMVDALKEDLRKQKVPDPNTAPPLYESDTDSDATAIDAESSPMQEPLRNVSVAINNIKIIILY